MNALTLTATRRRDKVVILHSMMPAAPGFSLRAAMRRAAAAIFSPAAAGVALAVMLAAMLWHILTIPAAAEAQTRIAADCLCALPWAAAALRHAAIRAAQLQKGGEL